MWTERFDPTGHLLAIREIVGRLDGRLDTMGAHFEQRLTRVEDHVDEIRTELQVRRQTVLGRNWQEIVLVALLVLLATGNLTLDEVKLWLLW